MNNNQQHLQQQQKLQQQQQQPFTPNSQQHQSLQRTYEQFQNPFIQPGDNTTNSITLNNPNNNHHHFASQQQYQQQHPLQSAAYSQMQSQNQYFLGGDDGYGGTDAMEYTPSASSNRNNAANSSVYQQMSIQQQQQSNTHQHLSETSPALQSQKQANAGYPGNVRNFEMGSVNIQSDDDQTEELLTQQYNQLQREQQTGSKVGMQNNKNSNGSSILHPPTSTQIPNVNLSLNQDLNSIPNQYNSNRSFTSNHNGVRNLQTPGFQSLNHSSDLLPLQQNQQHNLQLQQNQGSNNSQSNPPLQQNLVEQLSLKVKTQAERLQFLENYKTLCERRIRDFDQQHQLPILPSHIGMKTTIQNNSTNVMQKNSQQQNGQFDSILHQKIQDLQLQLAQQGELKNRLQQAEESLRQETLSNEEQRAYIKVLRESLDQKLTQVGLVFKNTANHSTGFDSNVDGYMHLINQQRQMDQLQKENQRLLKQLQDAAIQQDQAEKAMLNQFQLKIEELKQQHAQELSQLQTKLTSVKQKKKLLKKDKNQLLDFVEESLQKQQQEEKIKQELQDDQKRKEQIIDQLQQKLDDTKRDKQHQDDLLVQVQQNLRAMRDEKEKVQVNLNDAMSELDQLKSDNKEVNEIMKTTEEQLVNTKIVANDLDRQLADRNVIVARLESEVQRKEREIDSLIRGQQEIGKEKGQLIEVLRSQLDEQTQKSYTLEDSNHQLQRTLQATQHELDSLIKQYDLLSKSHSIQSNEFLAMKKQLNDTQCELDQRTRTYNDIKIKEDTLQKELQDVYGTLSSKTKVQQDQEQRLMRTLQDKDDELRKMIKKYEQIEQVNQEQSQKIDLLERVREQKDKDADKLKNTIDLKQNLIEDMQQQLIRTKAEFENQYLTTQRTLNLAQTDLERKDQEYNSKLNRTMDELKQLKEQKYIAEKVLGEKVEKTRELEIERVKLEEKLKRLEGDIGKLEDKQGKDKQKQVQVLDEVERFRSQRVDDAMLIEQLRNKLDDTKSNVNDVIGVLSSFQPYLDNLVQSVDENDQNLLQDIATKELTTLYEQLASLKILKNDQELAPSLASIKECVSSFIAYAKSINKKRNKQHQSLFNTQHYGIGISGGGVGIGGPHSPPQKDVSDWNVPQRIHSLAYQQTFVNPLNNTNNDLQQEYTMKSGVQGGVNTNFQVIHENLKVAMDQLQQEKDKYSLIKQKSDSLEEQSAIDKQHIQDLESLLRKLIAQKSIDPKLHRVMSDLFDNARDLIHIRIEKAAVTRQLIAKEQRYHTLNKANIQGLSTYQREISLLKSSIDRERQNLKELDQRLDEHDRRQKVLMEELQSIDSVINNKDYHNEIQQHGLQQENEELRKALAKTRHDKDWAEKRFIELEEQLNRFNMPSSLSRIDQKSEKADRTELSPHSIDNRSLKRNDSRLQWPKRRDDSPQNETHINRNDQFNSDNVRSGQHQLKPVVTSQLASYKQSGSQIYKRNQNSDKKPLYPSNTIINDHRVSHTDSYSLDNYNKHQQQLQQQNDLQQDYRSVGQNNHNNNNNNRTNSLQPTHVTIQQSSTELKNNNFNIYRSFQQNSNSNDNHNNYLHHQSQEQSIQLPPPMNNKQNNNQAHQDTHTHSGIYQSFPDNQRPNYHNASESIGNSALRGHFNNISHASNTNAYSAVGGGGQQLQSIGTEGNDQSSSVLKNKIMQVKTMFNQIRSNMDQ